MKEANNEQWSFCTHLLESYVNKSVLLNVWWMLKCAYIFILHTLIRLVFQNKTPAASWWVVAVCRSLQEAKLKHKCIFLMRARSLLLRVLTFAVWAHWPHFVGSVEISRPRHNCSQSLSWPALSCHWDSACFCHPVVLCHIEHSQKKDRWLFNKVGSMSNRKLFWTSVVFHCFCNGQIISFMCSTCSIWFCNVVVEQLDCYATHWHLTTEQMKRMTRFPRQHGLASKVKNSHTAA